MVRRIVVGTLKFRILLQLLLLTNGFLGAQTWSNPVEITPNGLNYEAKFTVDKLGRIHCVWAHEISTYFRQIYYTRSDDGGNTWLFKTQMSSNNTHWLGNPNIVTDSNANPYVSYDYMIESYSNVKVCYKKATGAIWGPQISVTEEMPGSEDNQIAIDKENKLYFFWKRGRREYYRVLMNDTFTTILQPYTDNMDNYYFFKAFFDEKNTLHCLGNFSQSGWLDNKLTYYKFNNGYWSNYIFVSDSLWNNGLFGWDLCVNHQGEPQIIWSQWPNKYTHNSYIGYYSYLIDTLPNLPELFSQESRFLAITTDRNDKKHIITCEYHNPKYQLVYYYYDGQSWTSKVLDQNDEYYKDISLISHDSTLYLLYIKEDTILSPTQDKLSKILFRKLDILAGIGTDFHEGEFKAYPNPFTDQVTISSGIRLKGLVHIRIFDILGTEIFCADINSNTDVPLNFNWNSMTTNKQLVAQGIYYVNIRNQGYNLCIKVIKN